MRTTAVTLRHITANISNIIQKIILDFEEARKDNIKYKCYIISSCRKLLLSGSLFPTANIKINFSPPFKLLDPSFRTIVHV